jgi:hypothetical protein
MINKKFIDNKLFLVNLTHKVAIVGLNFIQISNQIKMGIIM